MASRKTLKKAIKYISVELLTECYLKRDLITHITRADVDALAQKIAKLNYDLVGRINHTDGKENTAVTRNYYRKLKADWEKGVNEILKDVERLGVQ